MTAPRRRWSFGLRTLFVLVTSAAASLAGMIVPAIQSGSESNCGEFWKWKRDNSTVEENRAADGCAR
jgi:hypothetical protein